MADETLVPLEDWDMKSAVANQVLLCLPFPIGVYALWKHKPWKLPLFVGGAVAFLTVCRRYACARCRYYGRECSTLLGIATARMMRPNTDRELDRRAMAADFAFVGAVVMIPLPEALKSLRLAALYLGACAAAVGAILLNACPRCGNDFCPMKDLSDLLVGTGGGAPRT
jgi:hypothetical protein